MNIKYMFDRHDITKYQFLKAFLKNADVTIFPMKVSKEENDDRNDLFKEFSDSIWEAYYKKVRGKLDSKIFFQTEFDKKSESNVVFFDPDNGIEPKNKPNETHLKISDLDTFMEKNSDRIIIIYQHKFIGNNLENTWKSKQKILKESRKAVFYAEEGSKSIGFIVIPTGEFDLPEKIDGFKLYGKEIWETK